MKTRYIIYLLCLLLSPVFTSCEKDKEEPQNQLPNLFRPVGVEVKTNKTMVSIKWVPFSKSSTFSVDISEDSLKFENIIFSNKNLDTTAMIIELNYYTRYSVRIKANSSDEKVGDSEYQTVTFMTQNALKSVLPEKLNSRNVTMRWEKDVQATRLVFRAPGKDDLQFDLTSDDLTAGEKLCVGLIPLTNYHVVLYNNDKVRGELDISTPDNGLTPQDDWIGAIANAKAGDIITLATGTFVAKDKITITKPISIKGYSTGNRSVLKIESASATTCYTITLSEAGDVTFENLEFEGFLADNATRQQYLITPTNNMIKNLNIVNCKVQHVDRGFIRVNTAVPDGTLNVTVNNCQFYDVTNTGSDFIDFRLYAVGTITLQNSTLNYSARSRAVIRVDNYVSKVIVDHCTFYNVGGSASNPFIRNINNSDAKVYNNIFVNAPQIPYFLTTVTPGTVDIKYNDYFGSDALKGYAGQSSSYDLDPGFKDPANGDFTLPSDSPLRSAGSNSSALGDPRWAK